MCDVLCCTKCAFPWGNHVDCVAVLYTISGNECLGIRMRKVTNFTNLLPQKILSSQVSRTVTTPETLNDGERSFSPLDGQGQVLHLRVLLFDLLDEIHEDALQLGYQPGLRQAEVLVQCRCLFVPGGQTVVFSTRWLVCSLSSVAVGRVGGARRGKREKLQLSFSSDGLFLFNKLFSPWLNN